MDTNSLYECNERGTDIKTIHESSVESKRTRLSVIMSVYNEPIEWIQQSIDSILNQTYTDFEFIIVNDNPKRSENTSYLNRIKSTDERIIIIENPNNIGLARSLNHGISVAKGIYIARMDADDIAYPDRFQKQIDVLSTGEYDLTCSKYSSIDESGAIIKAKLGYNGPYDKNINREVQLNPSIIHHPTVMFTKAIFNKAGGYRNFPCAQDLDLWMRMAEIGSSVKYLPDILLKYRINTNSISRKRHFQQQLTVHYSYKLSVERIKKGKDSFSEEGYYKYLHANGFTNTRKELISEKLYSLLEETAEPKVFFAKINKIVKRTIVFMFYPSLRHYYLNKIYKNGLLKNDK